MGWDHDASSVLPPFLARRGYVEVLPAMQVVAPFDNPMIQLEAKGTHAIRGNRKGYPLILRLMFNTDSNSGQCLKPQLSYRK